MELISSRPAFYRVKGGQTLAIIAQAFRVPLPLLCKENALCGEIWAGQVLSVPAPRGNAYCVRGGERKALLCGSEEQFERINGTSALYIGQTVYLS